MKHDADEVSEVLFPTYIDISAIVYQVSHDIFLAIVGC